MMGTFGGALEARQIDGSNGKLTADVLRADAVGGLIGAALGHEGEAVTLLLRPEAKTRNAR